MKKHGSKRARLWLLTLVGVLAAAMVYAVQRNAPAVARESPFDEQRAGAHLRALVGFGPRPAGSEAIARARNYIVAELEKAGLKPQLDEFTAQTPRGPLKMVNIRAVRPGSRPTTIAISGHYDTKRFDFPFVGASDGGSSAAWLIEFARATANLKLENTLEFIFFDGEEAVVEWTDTDSVYGSRYDVDRRLRERTLKDLKALILVDMIGDRNLNIRKESQSSAWLTSIIWNNAQSRGYSREFVNEEQEVADDHVPYLKAGVSAVDLIDLDYPYWHTAADTLDKTSPRSLKIVGDVVYFSLPEIDKR